MYSRHRSNTGTTSIDRRRNVQNVTTGLRKNTSWIAAGIVAFQLHLPQLQAQAIDPLPPSNIRQARNNLSPSQLDHLPKEVGGMMPVMLSVSVPGNVSARSKYITKHRVPADQTALSWYVQGTLLAGRAGLSPSQSEAVMLLIWNHSVSRHPGFLKLVVAIAYTESRMRSDRESSKGARGMMQVTEPAATDVGSTDWHSPATNLRTGTQYLEQALREQGGSIMHALAQYNGGYRAVRALRSGDKLPDETAQYVLAVMQLYN